MPPIISRGFRGRSDDAPSGRVPPGQYVTRDFPVLSAGPTPHTPLDRWDFSIVGEVDEPRRWTWEEFRALPHEEVTVDIHCVTKWSKLDTVWHGVSVDTLLDGVETSAEYVVQFCDGGYTTNLPLEDVTGGKAWVAFGYDGELLDPSMAAPHGCSCPISTSGRARSGCAACSSRPTTSPVSGRVNGYHYYGDPWREQRYWGD
jgi:DMSO/TMAO reductase YedYZ molybdopterin-dependent catalytic subunit